MFAWLQNQLSLSERIADWFSPLVPYFEVPVIRASFYFLLTLLAAVFIRFIFKKVLLNLASRTKSDLDDQIILRLARPVTWSVLILGLWYSLNPFGLHPSVHHLVQGALSSLAIFIWCATGVSLARIVLERLSLDPDSMTLVKPRTLPVFTFIAYSFIFLGAAYFFFLSWDIDITGWLASAGIVGIAVGFAAKDTLANLFAGVFIVADGPYKIGDYLVLENGDRGRVTEIGMRSTRIQTLDNVQVVVPNANIAASTIMNLSGGSSERTRIGIPVGVAYDSDIELVRNTLLQLAAETKRVLKNPKPIVRFNELQDSAIGVTLLVWIGKPEHKDEVLDALNVQILLKFRDAGISIPFPQREVTMLGNDESPTG